jgi:hypothetical protein
VNALVLEVFVNEREPDPVTVGLVDRVTLLVSLLVTVTVTALGGVCERYA